MVCLNCVFGETNNEPFTSDPRWLSQKLKRFDDDLDPHTHQVNHRCEYINETLTTTPPRTDGRRDRGMLMEELNKLYQANKILLLEYTAVLRL